MTTVPAGLTAALQDRYRLERELGRGGMATVYLARDLRHDREVALKVLRPELAAVLGRERFLSEIRLTARLDHPRILTLIDSGERDGYLWYVLPYVRGESLRHRLQRERQLGATDAVVIAGNVAGALEYAHQHGVIHRDVKPENILLHEGEAMLTDFGIALALHEAGGERLTESGLSIGTPQYMSPEQATAERRLDARTDVFSLGAVTYEMLAGEPPFTGATGQAVIAKLMTMPPTPLHTFREALPAELDAVIAKALAKVPADRYPTAAAFGSALQDAMGQSGGRAAAPPPRSASISVASPREELTSRTTHLIGRPAAARRPPVWTWLAALGVVALATLLAFRLVQGGTSVGRRDPRLVELYQRARASYDLRTEAGTADAYIQFSEVVRQDSGYAAAWTGLAKTCVRAYIRFFSLPGISRDSALHLELAAVQRALALDPKSAEAWLAQAMVSRDVDPTELTPIFRALDRALALDSMSGPAWNQLGLARAESGDFPGAMKAWQRAVAVAPGYAEGISFLGYGYYWRRQFDSAQAWADSALGLEPTFLQPRQLIGQVAIERRDYARAVAAFEAARRLGGGAEEINALAGRALAEARAGRIAEARATLRRAESLGSAFTPAPLHTAVSLAQAVAQLGETTRAMAWLTRYQPLADLHFQMHLRCDPPFAPLENDPRFRQMLLVPRPPAGTGC